LRGPQDVGGPLREDRGDLVVVFLGDELVEAGFGVKKNGFDG
jgi:hypothetical protein